MSYITDMMPEMKVGKELILSLQSLPEYDEIICNQTADIRLMELSNLYNIYIPSRMSVEIYSKFYLALLHSLQKKGTKEAVKQHNENFKAIKQQSYNGIIGGADSFTIIGSSGIGKSSAINRAINLITENKIIEITRPHTKIIPCVVVQCPFDSSVKGLLLEILRKVDEIIDTDYYKYAVKARATTDMLIGSVSQVALNHIGLLVVDEIQNVVNNRQGKSLVGMLTQLINNSGISICMVGTPESSAFFEQAMQLARRSLGLQYGAMKYDMDFKNFCKALFLYRYVQNESFLTDSMVEWLYEHSGGITSVVVSLIHDAQEIAILTGKEVLNIETLNEAYHKRLTLLHGFIRKPAEKRKLEKPEKEIHVIKRNKEKAFSDITISEIAKISKEENTDIIELLKEHFNVTEVKV